MLYQVSGVARQSVDEKVVVGKMKSMSGTIALPDAYTSGDNIIKAVQAVDPVNALLWALSGFDTALVHFAELRQKLQAYPSFDLYGNDNTTVSLDRALSTYVEKQCETLCLAQGVPLSEVQTTFDAMITDGSATRAFFDILGATDDSLGVELVTYAMYLRCFTAHGEAPWSRAIAVATDCFYEKHPNLKGTSREA